MTNIPWKVRRNLENSLADFLTTQASGVTVFYKGANQPINITVGNAYKDDWGMPVISVYLDVTTAPRGFVGQNKRLKSYLMIIDVRGLDDGMRSDLAEWVTETINDGFDFYDYSPNSGDPDAPNKILSGKVSVDFLNDTPVRSTENAPISEKFRQRISVSLTIAV